MTGVPMSAESAAVLMAGGNQLMLGLAQRHSEVTPEKASLCGFMSTLPENAAKVTPWDGVQLPAFTDGYAPQTGLADI